MVLKEYPLGPARDANPLPQPARYEEAEDEFTDKFFPQNRFQMFRRIGQVYLVDQFSRALDRQLDWQKQNQGSFVLLFWGGLYYVPLFSSDLMQLL